MSFEALKSKMLWLSDSSLCDVVVSLEESKQITLGFTWEGYSGGENHDVRVILSDLMFLMYSGRPENKPCYTVLEIEIEKLTDNKAATLVRLSPYFQSATEEEFPKETTLYYLKLLGEIYLEVIFSRFAILEQVI